MTTVERVADRYRIIFDKAAKRMNKDIVITDEELRKLELNLKYHVLLVMNLMKS